ncbi:MAG: hypothetical protein M0Z80_11595, partial [Treponema sp.]|nr:hypothetical protein [Treponema sp.]
AVTLATNVIVGSTGNLAIGFVSTVDADAAANNRTLTVNTTGATSFGSTVGATQSLGSVTTNAGGTTTLTGNVTTSGAQTYNDAVTLAGNVTTITATATGTINFNSTVGQSGTQALTIQNAGSTGNVTFAGAVTLQGLVTGAGAYAVAIDAGGTITNAVAFTNTGGLTIVAGLNAPAGLTAGTAGVNTFGGTVQNDGAAGHDIKVSNLTVGASGLTLDAGLSNFVFTGTVGVGNVVTAVVPDPVDDPTDMTITAALIDGSVSGTLQLATGATVDIGSSNFNIMTLVNPGVDVITNPVTKTITRNVGIIRLTGLQTTHTIAAAGYSTASGAFLYYGAGGTIFTTGLVDTSAAPGPYNYWDLIINGTGIFTPEANLAVHGSIRLRTGVLDGSAALISVGSNWRNDVGAAAFVAGSNPLMGVQFLALTYPVYIWGDNTWFMFICTAPGATILFENDKMQQIATGGIFRVKSSGATITLSRLNPGTLPPLLPDSSGNPSNPPLATDDALFWFFDLAPGSVFDMNNVHVYYSNARSDPVSVPAGVIATPYATHYCFKWLDIAYSIYSYTEDSDYNGKIDRIRVTTESNLDPALTDFSGFTVAVQGYDIDTSKGTNGYSVPIAGKTYYIYLKEKPYNDTNVTPLWHIVSNTTFRDTGGKIIGTLSEAGGSDWMTPGDTAWPYIGYTLAIPGQSTAFIHLSEPVVTSGGGTPAATDLGFSAFVLPLVTTSGSGIQEATGAAPTAPTASNVADASNLLTLTGTLRDMGHAPHWESTYNNQVIAPPNPTYPPVSGYLADPNTYALAGGQADSDRITANPFNLWRGGAAVGASGANVQHRVSDVLISVPMVATTDLSYFAWPIYAKDQVQLSLTDAQIAALTPAQTAAEGIGLIRAFDGSQWLRADDITVQAALQPALSAYPLTLWFDSNVASSLQNSGLWLPSFSEAGFSGLVPYPNASPWGRGASYSLGTSIGSNLWNFILPKSDPRIVSISNLGFFFTLQTPPLGSTPLYAARLDIPAGTAIPSNWYRLVKPFSFEIHDVRLQRGGASILNNVIDPTRGETARLSYQLPSSGAVTVTVFTLDGDVVKRLVLATQAAGDYSVDWDGKNMGGRPVARGVYFIRVVAPNIDEIRKVLVVRK